MEKRNSQLEHGQPMDKQEACPARATRVWLAVNHNTRGEYNDASAQER